jgi:hypothetical protein
MGDVMVLGTSGYEPPNKDNADFASFACLHESVCSNVQALGNRLWWDKGSGASADLTLWHASAEGAVDPSTFVGIGSYQEPPSEQDLRNLEGTVACVKDSALIDNKALDRLLTRLPVLAERLVK